MCLCGFAFGALIHDQDGGVSGPNASDSPALDSHASGPEEPVEPAGGPLQEPAPQEEGAADSEGGPKDSEALVLV